MQIEQTKVMAALKHAMGFHKRHNIKGVDDLSLNSLSWQALNALQSDAGSEARTLLDKAEASDNDQQATQLADAADAMMDLFRACDFEKDQRAQTGSREPRQHGGSIKRPIMASGRVDGDALAHHMSLGDEARQLRAFFETGEGLERRDILATGTGAQGGFALPELISRTVQDQVQQVNSNDYLQLIGVRGTATAWNAETTVRAATAEPTMAEVKPTMGELWAYPVISQWALDDLVINAENWLQTNVADAFAQAEGAAFVSGDGTTKPTGFLAGPTPVTTADTSRAFGTLQYIPSGAAGAFVAASATVSPADVLANIIYTLRGGYRTNARWVMNSKTAGVIRQWKDMQGRFIWVDNLIAGQPALLMGYPVVIAEDMPDIAANAFPIAFGDFGRGYLVADRTGMRIIRDDITRPGFVRYLISKRVGGKILDSNAIKLLKMSAS
jgi:HK97 family phage major capsid protein